MGNLNELELLRYLARNPVNIDPNDPDSAVHKVYSPDRTRVYRDTPEDRIPITLRSQERFDIVSLLRELRSLQKIGFLASIDFGFHTVQEVPYYHVTIDCSHHTEDPAKQKYTWYDQVLPLAIWAVLSDVYKEFGDVIERETLTV